MMSVDAPAAAAFVGSRKPATSVAGSTSSSAWSTRRGIGGGQPRGSHWGDAAARVLLSAGLVTFAIPVLFFVVLVKAESGVVKDTLWGYITDRCRVLGPWIKSLSISGSALTKETGAPALAAAKRAKARNNRLRVFALVSSGAASLGLLALGVGVWTVHGQKPLLDAAAHALVALAVFSVVEVVYIFAIARAPLLGNDPLDVAVLERLASLSCCPA